MPLTLTLKGRYTKSNHQLRYSAETNGSDSSNIFAEKKKFSVVVGPAPGANIKFNGKNTPQTDGADSNAAFPSLCDLEELDVTSRKHYNCSYWNMETWYKGTPVRGLNEILHCVNTFSCSVPKDAFLHQTYEFT